jgi:Methyltransferase domain
MNKPLRTLDELGLESGTDKSSAGHDYLFCYEKYFAPLRNQPVKLLEIGVAGGASLLVWEAYFPNGAIVGVDIDAAALRFVRARVAIEIMDQSNLEQLVQLGVNHGPFDIIIEDGSHMWEHQITTLRTLFPFVRSGGLYIVEDLETNFGSLTEAYRGASSLSCVEYLKRLVDLRVGDDQIASKSIEDPFLRTYGRRIRAITFHRHACVIEKEQPRSVSPRAHQPYVSLENEPALIALALRAHIGNEGDRTSASSCIRSQARWRKIQGFRIDATEAVDCELRYRARLDDGTWTDWAACGEYVGTRAMSRDLTGFAVRLGAPSRENFTLQVVGEFADSLDPVFAEDGVDCIARSGLDTPLVGMQILLRARHSLDGVPATVAIG